MNQSFFAECRNHDIVIKPGTNTNVLAENRDSIQVTANDKLKLYLLVKRLMMLSGSL